jgi:cyclophilin family peptidyl-prolyl cis-trans isomerase/HEAT repeat protein
VNAEKGWARADVLAELARSDDSAVRNAAARALGRLEDPNLVLPLLSLPRLSVSARGDAVAQSLKGFDPATDPRLVQTALEWLYVNGDKPLDLRSVGELAEVMMPLGRIHYANAEQLRKAEGLILRIAVFARPDPRIGPVYQTGVHALEVLARMNTRVAVLHEDTVAELEKAVNKQSANDSEAVRRHALAALINGRGLSGGTETIALADEDWQVRRLAVSVLAGSGAGLDDGTRVRLIEEALDDQSAPVRYEALRAYVRHAARTNGCDPILDLRTDRDLHVALAALDALGELCKDDEEITGLIMAEARVPSTTGSWHRETHAFVALAKRSPEKAATVMEAFVSHPVWWVRMYAAGAAAAAGDLARLDKLAHDVNDNVREAAIEPLRRLKRADAEPAIVAALDRDDVQLLRTAARLLTESPATPSLSRPLLAALMRLTKGASETSRDARLALLDAIAVHASAADATMLLPLLRDFDPKVAERAARIIGEWTGRQPATTPSPPARGWPQEFLDLRQCVSVSLGGSAGSFTMKMQPASAPIAVDRFLELATRDKYYNGLTFHRVVPNFVIQGGSPGANEYAGHKEYMRDEVGGRNVRGSVGLSTRGRNTGDAQFYINLVDNNRLDYEYTVFATIADMAAVDKIQEGDIIRSIDLVKCGG